MKKYDVFVHELQWRNVIYRVEAESEDEAREFIEDYGEGDVISDDFDFLDQMDIEKIVEICK